MLLVSLAFKLDHLTGYYLMVSLAPIQITGDMYDSLVNDKAMGVREGGQTGGNSASCLERRGNWHQADGIMRGIKVELLIFSFSS